MDSRREALGDSQGALVKAVLVGVMLLVPLAAFALVQWIYAPPAPIKTPVVTPEKIAWPTKDQIYICRARTSQGEKFYFTLVPPGAFQEQGLARECIVGTSQYPIEAGATFSPDNFARNPLFVKLLHQVVAEEGPKLAGLQADAKEVGEGPVIVFDLRTANPEARDVIGYFQAKDGKLLPDSYQRGQKHMLLSQDGFFRLEPALHIKLLERLHQINEERKKNAPEPDPNDTNDFP